MKIKVNQPVEIEVTHIQVCLPVRYEDEDMPYDFPLRDGDKWMAKINIDTGAIEGWPEGRVGEFYMKVCDSGSYSLLNSQGHTVTVRDDYVPHGVIPGDYGDYVNLDIDTSGRITNWPENPDLSEFFDAESED